MASKYELASPPVETTRELVDLIRAGDMTARERLLRRYHPLLTRWARGRIPSGARDLNDTADLVQVALMRAFQTLPTFEVQGHGAFFGFLRTVMTNIIRDEARRVGRRPRVDAIEADVPDAAPTPLQNSVSAETLKAYEQGLSQLDDEQREVIIMRVELGLSNEEIASMTDAPTTNAARMRISRALSRLAELMGESSEPEPHHE